MDANPPRLSDSVRTALEKALREFFEAISPPGFARTRAKFWTRRGEHHVEFIHAHRQGSSYGAPYNASVGVRLHLGIAVLNDGRPPALNGPCTDDLNLFAADRFHLRFNAVSGSTYDRCLADMARFVRSRGEPWFARFSSPAALLEEPSTPLDAAARDALAQSLSGQASPARIAESLKRFGIRQQPSPAARG